MSENISIVWDLENVTPSANSLFIEGLNEYAESLGRVVSARAYCDWSSPYFKKLGPLLSRFHYYLVQVPRGRGKQKNSADIHLVADTLELLRLYNHISTFLLVTGDSDFRPLVTTLRRAGKRIHIICDMKTASQELLALADSFRDYRDLVPLEDEEQSDEDDTDEEAGSTEHISPRDYWFTCLAEAASMMLQNKKSPNMGALKIKMKILNPHFEEKALRFKRWSDFVNAASKAEYVKVEEENGQTRVIPGKAYQEGNNPLSQALGALLDVLRELDRGKSNPQFHHFGQVKSELIEKKVNTQLPGLSKFSRFIQVAEARNLVETKSQDMNRYIKRLRKYQA